MRKIFYIVIVTILLSSCMGEKKDGLVSLDVFDDANNELKLNHYPTNVISLAPNLTEIMFALGASDKLVGVSNYCDYPEGTRNIEKVGGMLDPDYEKVASLKPDLILMTVEGNSKSSFSVFKNLNYNVFVSNPRDIKGIKRTISKIGYLVNKNSQADSIIRNIDSVVTTVSNEFRGRVRFKCFVVISIVPLITVNKNSYINDVLEVLNLQNIFGNETLEYPTVNYESVIKENPEVIIVPIDISNQSKKKAIFDELRKKLNSTTAIKNNRLISVDENLLMRPGPRITKLIENLRSEITSAHWLAF
ncbi:MAG: ABC transporter substrate-binding protein [Ignavibacteria bacterium]